MNTPPFSSREHSTIARYMDQPSVMPEVICTKIEAAWNNKPVQLYAMIDLNSDFQMSQSWLALGPEQVAVAHEATPDGGMVIRDLAGDLYHIADPDNLDRKSARLLWSFRD